jgi:hypothetical protein
MNSDEEKIIAFTIAAGFIILLLTVSFCIGVKFF